MRILICSNVYPPVVVGGAELVAHEQARAFERMGHEVRAFAGDPASPLPRHGCEDGEHEGVPVRRIALAPEDYSPEFLNFFHPDVDARFREVLRAFAPDVVHCHNLMGLSVRLAMIARAHGARTVCTLHDFWGFCPGNTAVRPDGAACAGAGCCQPRLHDGRELDLAPRLRRDFVTLALDRVDRFVAPSRHVANRYAWAGFAPDRIAVIPNGVDADRFRPVLGKIARPDVRLTYAGYFGAHKGVSTLLDALAALPGGVNLQLAGEGPEEERYRAQVAALGLGNRVRFLGKVPPADMPRVYAASDVVVLPSVWEENQPVCLMEAMAAGLPVVASHKGGIPELVEHGVNGLMFAAGDAADLAVRLATLVADPGLRRTMGEEGRRRVVGCGHDRQAGRLLDLFAGIAAPARAGRERPDVFAVTGDRWEELDGREPLLDPTSDPARRPRLFVPLAWVGDCVARFNGALFAADVRQGRGLRHVREVIRFPRWASRIALAMLRRIDAGPPNP